MFLQQQFPSRLWQAYLRNLTDRPLTTKAVCAAVIFSTSDVATQWMEHRRPRRDAGAADSPIDEDDDALDFLVSRAWSGAGFGVVATVWLHHWWNWLERTVATARFVPLMVVRRNRLATALTKVCIDQSIGAPLYIYTYYLVTNVLGNAGKVVVGTAPDSSSHLHHRDDVLPNRLRALCNDAQRKANELFWPTMVQHWHVWPAVHALNFYFVPLHHRVLVQNAVLVGWSGYLSHLNHGGPALRTPVVDPTVEAASLSMPPHPDERPRTVLLRRTSSLVLALPKDEGAVAKKCETRRRRGTEANVSIA